jgi:DNA polymerase elongation subunit (family B)
MVGNNYKRGCPMHVRGSILYNKALKENKLENRYQLIRGGDKIKIVYLSIPNPIKENVISFPNVLPKELNVDKYIDYNTQFEKVFLGPIESILEAIGWRSKKVASLESFFM